MGTQCILGSCKSYLLPCDCIHNDPYRFYVEMVLDNTILKINTYWKHRCSWHGITPPPPFNFLLTYLFSIKFLYFFIISSLFPYFNLFVSIFIQSYVNRNLHVSTQYILIIHKARNSETVNIVHLLASVTFSSPYSHYIIQTRTCINS